jgi:hypothetical protein
MATIPVALHRDSVADQEAVRLSQFCAKVQFVMAVVNSDNRHTTTVCGVSVMKGTFSRLLQDLALRKSTCQIGTDKVAKAVPICIRLKLSSSKGLHASKKSRDWNFRSNLETAVKFSIKLFLGDYCISQIRRLLLIQQRTDRSSLLQATIPANLLEIPFAVFLS